MPHRDDDWYRYPRYYDLVYRRGTAREAGFFEQLWQRHGLREVHSLLEPACGTGRLVAEFAKRGYRVRGFDLCEPTLEYARQRLRRRKLEADLAVGDMASFPSVPHADAAYNPYSTFRYLTTEAASAAHLRCVADTVLPGGIYVLGFHLLGNLADQASIENYQARQGDTQVGVEVRVVRREPAKRLEWARTTLSVRSPRKSFDVRTEAPMRTYTAQQFRDLLAKVPSWRLVAVYDFHYRLDRLQDLDDELFDVVAVLQRQAG